MTASEVQGDSSAGPATGDGVADTVAHVLAGASECRLRSVADRADALRRLQDLVVGSHHRLWTALHLDLGRSEAEADLTELSVVRAELDHAIDRLEHWTRPRRLGMPIALRPGSARAHPVPLGAVLIIAPCSSPIRQLLVPLVAAISAGNTAVLKPSEHSVSTARALSELFDEHFEPHEVGVVHTGPAETERLIGAGFDHVVFSGSASAGRSVLRSAADTLTPVTMVLGSKSPSIVAPSADVGVAARRIAWGKFVNAGQSCLAPDYVLLHRPQHREFVEMVTAAIAEFFGTEPHTSPEFGRIVTADHVDRLADMIRAGGYQAVAAGGRVDREARYVEPTVLSGVHHDAAVMSDEVFGPILPVLAYESIDDAIDFVNARPHPLAFYPFAGDRSEVDRLVRNVAAGTVTVNHTVQHASVADLPFGGIGASGTGVLGGEHGFRTLSQLKPVLRRMTRPDPRALYPPMSRAARSVIRRLS